MVNVLQPKVSGDAATDSWAFEVTNSANDLDSRVTTLESEIILTSPNGTRYRLIVNNAGTLSTEAIT